MKVRLTFGYQKLGWVQILLRYLESDQRLLRVFRSARRTYFRLPTLSAGDFEPTLRWPSTTCSWL